MAGIVVDRKELERARFLKPQEEVERIFARSLLEWQRDTRVISDQVALLMHPAHLRIIGLGPQALPCIFKSLSEGGGPWFVALEAIVGENPASSQGAKASQLREDWLTWGREHGYLGA